MALDDSTLVHLFGALADREDERGGGKAADGDPDGTGDDPLALVRRIEAEESLGDPRVRAAVAEVADAMAHADPEATLSPHVRRAMIAAQRARLEDAPRVGGRLGPAPGTARTPARPRAPAAASSPGLRRVPTMARVAALVILALGAGLFLASRREAGATLRVAGLDRLASDGSRREMFSARTLPAGTALAGDEGEFLVVTLPSGGRLLLGSGDEVAIVGVPRGAAAHDARLALVAGDVRLDATMLHADGGAPVEIDMGHQRVFTLSSGRALLRREAAGVIVVPDAGATFRIGGEGAARAAGPPLFVPFGGDVSPRVDDLDTDALLEPWPRLSAPPRPVDGGWRVAPRRWRVVSGAFERRGRTLHLAPSSRSTVIAWAPFGALASADALDLRVEGGPAFVRVRLDGAQALLLPSEPGTRRVVLPPDWLDALQGRELELEFTRPAAPAPRQPVVLHDATFTRATPATPSSVPTSARPGESDAPR